MLFCLMDKMIDVLQICYLYNLCWHFPYFPFTSSLCSGVLIMNGQVGGGCYVFGFCFLLWVTYVYELQPLYFSGSTSLSLNFKTCYLCWYYIYTSFFVVFWISHSFIYGKFLARKFVKNSDPQVWSHFFITIGYVNIC